MDCQFTSVPSLSKQPLGYILSRKEAKARLSKLTPGTDEYYKLQNALLKSAGISEINLSSTTYKVDTSSHNCKLLGGFGSSEHVAIGEAVELKGLPKNTALFIKGVTPIQFAHIVALAGDFYGVVGGAISLPGGDDQQKTERFKQAFDTLANADNYQLQKIVQEINLECEAVKNASLPHHCYSSQMIERNKRMKKIKNDIDDLLLDNSDHFSAHAKEAYRIGHAHAMSMAAEAGRKKDLEGLKRAYALDAFACHFLTDLFAAGHIRNQRGELEVVLTSKLGFLLGLAKPKLILLVGALTAAQHEQDGNAGLNVSNKKGDQWRAFGDGHFFAPKNEDNRKKVIEATQQSVNEVHTAYQNPDNPVPSIMNELIPEPTFFNAPPIYSVEGNSLFFHEGTNKIEVQSKSDQLSKGISQALRYVPQEYINQVLTLDIGVSPVISKVIVPQIERITGSLWHMIGIATYHQVKKESSQLNEKINEMAGVVISTYKISLQILEQIKIVDAKVDEVLWRTTCTPIKTSIETIKSTFHQYQTYILDVEQQNQAKHKLWEALMLMSSVLSMGTADGQNVLVAYRDKLKDRGSEMSPQETHVAVTLWFRQMLDCQVQAFSLYSTLQLLRNDQYLEQAFQLLKNDQKENEILLEEASHLLRSNHPGNQLLLQQVLQLLKNDQKGNQKLLEKALELLRSDHQGNQVLLELVLQLLRSEHKENQKLLKKHLQFLENYQKEKQTLKQQALQFELSVRKQIECNQQHIDLTLIDRSESYILLQLEKSKTQRLAFHSLQQK